jgi:ABC-2 type transport system permease protein
MNIKMKQVFAGLRKELCYFARTHRLMWALILFAVMVTADVIMMAVMPAFFAWYDQLLGDLSQQAGMDIGGFSMSELGQIWPDATVANGIIYAATESMALILPILLVIFIAPAAGGEQNKKAMVIPYCLGLKPVGYVLPKFIFYPVAALCLGWFGTMVSYLAAVIILPVNDIALTTVMFAGLFVGLYFACLVAVQLCIGLCTGRPVISATITLVSWVMFIPMILEILRVGGKYNPLALMGMATNILSGWQLPPSEVINMVCTVIITIGLICVLYLITLFGQSSQRVDNRGNDMLL